MDKRLIIPIVIIIGLITGYVIASWLIDLGIIDDLVNKSLKLIELWIN